MRLKQGSLRRVIELSLLKWKVEFTTCGFTLSMELTAKSPSQEESLSSYFSPLGSRGFPLEFKFCWRCLNPCVIDHKAGRGSQAPQPREQLLTVELEPTWQCVLSSLALKEGPLHFLSTSAEWGWALLPKTAESLSKVCPLLFYNLELPFTFH